MTSFTELHDAAIERPDHTQLLESVATFVKNSLGHPPRLLLTEQAETQLERVKT